VEQQTPSLRASAIEAEGEFVEIIVEMRVLDAALVGANQPSLEKGGDLVHPGHDFTGWLVGNGDDRCSVVVA
jgi:hypothetical protein